MSEQGSSYNPEVIYHPQLPAAAGSLPITEQIIVSSQQTFPEGRAGPETQATLLQCVKLNFVQEEEEEETCGSYQSGAVQ